MPGAERVAPAGRFEAIHPRLLSRVLQLWGEARLRVGGTSMLPAIRPADVILIRRVDITRVELDDVILVQVDGRLIAHRVVRADFLGAERVLITRGDMHTHDDRPVTAAQVLGRVEGRLRNGRALPLGRAPRRRRAGTIARLRFESLCRLRRCAESIRSRASRAAGLF